MKICRKSRQNSCRWTVSNDIILNRRGLRARKGAPDSFDFAGFETLLKRIRSGEPDIAIPVFDRSIELSRAAAEIVGANTRFILVEGNYLLLDEEPWSRLGSMLGMSLGAIQARAC
jgi:pantothenate kinase